MRLAAFEPDIPQNLGAMIRLCACFAVPIDVIGPCGFPFSVKALRRSAMDYADIAEIAHHDDFASFERARRPARLIVLSTGSTQNLWDFNFFSDDILLVGRESAGVTPDVLASADESLLLPMPGGGRSLNVAQCAGIALSEALRQNNHWTT